MTDIEQKRRKKLCVIMPTHWSHKIGGAEYQVKCIIDVLVASGQYDIYFVTRHVDPSYTPVGYRIIKIKNVFRVSQGRYLFDVFALLRTLKMLKPDIIYQRRGLAYTGFCAYYARRNGSKFVWHVAHDDDVTPLPDSAGSISPRTDMRRLLGQFIRVREKKVLEYGIGAADEIVAQTQDQANYLYKHYGRTASIVMHNFHPLPTEDINKTDMVHVVWVANVKPMKRPEVFLRLARDLGGDGNVRFTMVGALEGGRKGSEFSSQIEATPEVQYLGAVSQGEVNAILAKAHILVNTSIREGFSNTFIQAWMRKVPVVSLCVNPDGVFDKVELGYCSGSYEKLREDVHRLIEGGALRESMGNAAQAYAFEKHSERQTEMLMALL